MVKDQSLWTVSVDGQVVAIPEAHHEWSREPSTFRAKSLRAGEKNPHKVYIVWMLNACTLG